MILMVVAVGCGLGASYMTSKLLAERKGPPPEEKVSVVVAKTKVPKLTHLKDPDKFFEVRQFPKAMAPKSYYSSLKEIKDKRVNRELKADVHISAEDVQDKNTGLPIPDGFGAVGVKITAVSAASYFVTPGDRVDIMLTQRGENANCSTILRDMLVLSVGERVQRPEDANSGVMQAQTVTIAVKADEAKTIRLAETVGDLSFVLRKEGEKAEFSTDTVVTRDFLKRAGRGLGTSPLTAPPPEEDPGKLPFGLDLTAIQKKVDDGNPETPPEPIKPSWTVTVEKGALPPEQIHLYKRPDGGFGRDPGQAEKPEAKKPEGTDEKKPEPKEETKPDSQQDD
jgi:Flp pilus assembly protein CpaB